MMEYIYLVIKVKGIDTVILQVREAYQSLKPHLAFYKEEMEAPFLSKVTH